jgi:hypothetical protein
MHSARCPFTYALSTVVVGATLFLVAPVKAEDSTTVDFSRQPHLKAWSNVIPNANKRFIVLPDFNNEAVLDRETGLVWEQTPKQTVHTWNLARVECTSRLIGGRKGWRLPSLFELATLMDPSQSNPALPAGHPFGPVVMDNHWTATLHAADLTRVWVAYVPNGGTSGSAVMGNQYPAWCVRGPMNASQY